MAGPAIMASNKTRHPLGTGVPGLHNWSGTDEHTIQVEPLGSPAALVGWSCSIVRTPKGWVGRIDNYKTGQTKHVPVSGVDVATVNLIEALKAEKAAKEVPVLAGIYTQTEMELGEADFPEELVDRGDYYTDREYLDDLARLYDCELDEFEIDTEGFVFLGNTQVGEGIDPDFDPFEDEENEIDVLGSEDTKPSIWSRWFRRG
jgi:hypothetical protein